MASSGSFNTTAYSSRYLTFSWNVQSQSIANNTTTISWNLKGAGGGSTWYKSGNFKVVINGSTVYSSATRIELRNGTLVASGTFTMAHDNYGNKTFSAYAEAGIYTVAVNCSGSGSWSLPQIPRYATSNQTLSSKTETSITMNWSSDSVVDYIWYSSNNGSSWTGVDVADGTSGSYTISGLTANTTYNIKTRVRRKDSQLTTDSATTSITTYAYPYANSMPNFTIGNTLTIGIYNPLGRTYTVTVIGNDNSQMVESASFSGTSISGFKTTSYINFWYASIPNSKTGTYKVKVTYGNISTTKTGGTYTVNPSDCLPVIGSASYEDTSSTVTAITGNNQLIVRNQSTVKFTASSLVGNKSATISSCSVAINGTSYNMTVSSNSATVSNVTIDSSQDVTATFTVTDSRGVTNTTNINVTMLDWVLPTAIISCQRQSNYYSSTNINVNADYSSVDNKNTITIKVRYKKTSDSSYGAYTTLSDGVTSTITLDNLYEWDVQVLLTDLFGSTTYNLVVPIGMPIMYIDRLLNSVGFNCFPTTDKGVWSEYFPMDDVIYLGSQVLYDSYTMTTSGKVAILGSYNYNLIDGLFTGITIPSAYVRAYRITAQMHTQNNNQASVYLNNFQSNLINTWSNTTMRKIGSTRIFKESEITLETTYGYSKDGTNLYCSNSGNYTANFWNITVHCYLVKSTTNLEQVVSYQLTNSDNSTIEEA